jgi:glycosyltransferase involved in cell wall biosynthesis
MVDFTVAIRTYNGAKRFPEVLKKLRSQVGTDDMQWEVIIIDNNSTDDTAQVIRDYQENWPAAYPLKYYFEPEQGASVARRRAIMEARGPLVGFLDDDNVPAPNWVSAAYAFGKTRPNVAAYGGQVHGQFEAEPPPNFHKIASLLAIKEWGSQVFRHDGRVLPPGAGLVIRKQAWLDCVPRQLRLRGPIGKSLMLKGEDIEALTYIRRAGWEIWYNPEMEVYHRIPHWRLEKEYLLKLCRGVGLSRYTTRMLGCPSWRKPLMVPLYAVNDLRKMIRHWIQHRHVLHTDTIAACELELLKSSLVSPFRVWKEYVLRQWRITISKDENVETRPAVSGEQG